MKLIRVLFFGAAALGLAVTAGCQNEAAVKALQELTAKLTDTVNQQNNELSTLAGQMESCKMDLAKLHREGALVKSEDPRIEVPAVSGTVNVSSLENLKKALTETAEKQKARLEELRMAADTCRKDLATAKQVAARAKAATPREPAKPTAVKKAEAAGQPTSGVKSRYKTRQ
jgi:chromosome segregation ATPase